ncbi:UDP-galactopyranose mutase [Candidatus Pelagibacter sp. HIMB1485]|uniref:UDP-galactopyranose mutase n=1 Tax=Candidatus Pelagibacter sp. HIMB1485 TaxID=3415415 RepID=UPI003F8745D5
MKINTDVLIIGAGPVGCVIAERLSNELNLKCKIIENRDHIAGNCYDAYNKKGVLYHKYGPHYLRFKNKKTYDYLSKFTKWIEGDYIVKSVVNKKLYSFPINLDTLENFFNVKLKNKNEAINFLKKKIIKIKNPKNSEEVILNKLGRQIYDNFYKNYTIKQWGISPKKLDKSVAGRVPIRFNRNPFYVNEKLRFMPKHGFTQLFKNMTKNKNISIIFNTDYFKIKNKINVKYFTIYTGTPDRFFNFKYGKLDWRSLRFVFKTHKKKLIQECVQYNYPNDHKFTRKVEIKHVTKQKTNYTVISKEFPTNNGDPYYPIINKKNLSKFKKYEKLMNNEMKNNIFFEGRLARYKYFNTDEVIESALVLYKKLKKTYKNLVKS